jgi:hypothetical protein
MVIYINPIKDHQDLRQFQPLHQRDILASQFYFAEEDLEGCYRIQISRAVV